MARSSGMDTGGIIKLALFGVGGYFLYDWWSKRKGRGTDVAAPPSSTNPNTGGFTSLDAIYSRVAAAVGSTPYTADQYNFYLQRELPAGKTAPAPEAFLAEGADRNATMTLANYWGAVVPKLKSDLGLSGLRGLGVYGDLYRLLNGPSSEARGRSSSAPRRRLA